MSESSGSGLAVRSMREEEMDLPSVPPEVYARCLHDLGQVNAVTFTHRPTVRWVARSVAAMPAGQPVRVLDVACGHGDLLRAIGRWGQQAGRDLVLEGIDLNPRSAEVAGRATPPGLAIFYRTGDVFAYSPDPKPDLIVTSQFTHHLTDAQLVAFLRWIDAQAAQGWCIVDIQRHVLAYYGFPLLARAAFWHRIVRQDGQISVARGFRRKEWEAALSAAGVRAEIGWVFPFRYRVSRGA